MGGASLLRRRRTVGPRDSVTRELGLWELPQKARVACGPEVRAGEILAVLGACFSRMF